MTTPYLSPPVFSWPAAPGGKLHTYQAGGVVAQATYSDAAGVTPNTNPVTLDSNGSAVVRLAVGVAYHVVLKDSTDVTTIWDADNIDNAYLTTSGITASIIGAALYPQTAAELAAGVTPTNYTYPPGNVLRYGTNTTPGTTDMTTAIQAAINAAARGNPAAYVPAGTYAYKNDITIPTGVFWLQGGAGPFGVDLYGDGPTESILQAIAGGSFTNGIYISGGASWKLAGTIRGIQVNANQIASAGITASFVQNLCIRNCVVRGSTGRGIYVDNSIMTSLEQVYMVANGSVTTGQLEIDGTLAASTGGTTTTVLSQVYIAAGNVNCLGGLLLDRSSNTLILNGAFESSDVPCKISSKTSTTTSCVGVTFIGTDFENPLDHYIEVGYGLTGVYVQNLEVRGCSGFPSGATAVPYGVKLSMVNGARFAQNTWAQINSPIATYWFEGTNPLRITLEPHNSMAGQSWPYLKSNGVQVAQATPLVEYNSQESPAKPLVSQLVASGTTIANSINAQGGYYERIGMNNVGATNVTTMTGNATQSGTRVYIVGDGFSTAVHGTGANQFQNKSGANTLWAANTWYVYMYNGAWWVQLGT